ncbi:MAG TPA: hypothetical protein PLY90_06710, partial [Candidatus Hydrogenedentes bacterium]|nr:hypothetical protein [Candidatus Hydrogenedentota bacterium]
MDKTAIINYLIKHGIVAVVRADSGENLVPIIEAVMEGGVRCIEITMTTPGALECLALASEKLSGA